MLVAETLTESLAEPLTESHRGGSMSYLSLGRGLTPSGTLGIVLFVVAILCVVIPIVINRRKNK